VLRRWKGQYQSEVAQSGSGSTTHAEVSCPASIYDGGQKMAASACHRSQRVCRAQQGTHEGANLADDLLVRQPRLGFEVVRQVRADCPTKGKGFQLVEPTVARRVEGQDPLRLLRTSLPTRSFLPTATSPSTTPALSLTESMTACFLASTSFCSAMRVK
jgi:hypothetical protein